MSDKEYEPLTEEDIKKIDEDANPFFHEDVTMLRLIDTIRELQDELKAVNDDRDRILESLEMMSDNARNSP